MAPKKTAQCGYPSMEKNPQSQPVSGFENPILKVSVTDGVIYNRLEAFWLRQTCESKENPSC